MITEFMWLKHGKPLPEGWQLADQTISHHSHYAVLIVREVGGIIPADTNTNHLTGT